MTRTLRLKLLILLNIACIGNGIVYGQQATDAQNSYNAGEPFLVNTFDVDQVRVVPIKGMENPFSMAFRENGDILVTERYTGKLRLIRDGKLIEEDTMDPDQDTTYMWEVRGFPKFAAIHSRCIESNSPMIHPVPILPYLKDSLSLLWLPDISRRWVAKACRKGS